MAEKACPIDKYEKEIQWIKDLDAKSIEKREKERGELEDKINKVQTEMMSYSPSWGYRHTDSGSNISPTGTIAKWIGQIEKFLGFSGKKNE